ncbi:hypothetical protein [Paraburkholderia sp. UCT70]|uniref:hypothetical protein n=1 Tax=Paraburkholderia sp. UCT70 TaxID=2991068 RepID=UPI003D220F69
MSKHITQKQLCSLLNALCPAGGCVAYIVGFTVSEDANPEIRDGLSGLLAWHVLYSDDHHMVITYWASKETFDTAGEIWKTSLGISQFYKGRVGSIEGLREGFFKRFRKGTPPLLQNTVILLAGVLAAITTIREFNEYLFATPAITVQFDSQTTDFVKRRPVSVKFTLENETTEKNEDITIAAKLMQDAADDKEAIYDRPIALTVSETTIAELNPKEKKDLLLTYPPPSVDARTKPLASGRYHVEVSVTSYAGPFSHTEGVSSRKTPVTIWPDEPKGHILGSAPTDPRTAPRTVSGIIRLGALSTSASICTLQIVGFRGLPMPASDLPTQDPPKWTRSQTNGPEVDVLSWTLPPNKGMQELYVNFTFDAPADLDWTAIRKASELSCWRPKEPIK